MEIRKIKTQRKSYDMQSCNYRMKPYKPYINTFRQIIENMDKKNNQNNTIKDSPKTLDYRQIMNKYSHYINEENLHNKDQIYSNSKLYDQNDRLNLKKNNYYAKTETNNNVCSKNQSNINANVNNFFQFCKTEEEDETANNCKYYYTFKNFYQKPSSTSQQNIKTNIRTNNNINYTNINNNKFTNIFPNNLQYNNRDNNINKNYNNNTCRGNHRSSKMNSFFNSNNLNTKNHSHSCSSGNIGINKELDNFFNIKQKIAFLEKENSSLKKYNNNLYNKIIKFISLCQKYGECFENSSNYFKMNNLNTNKNKNNYSNNESLEELKFLFEQYNNMLNNISKMFKKWDPNNNQNTEEVFNLNKFEPKSLNFTEKYIAKINNLRNEKTEIFEELNKTKKRTKNLLLEKEEHELIILKLRNENETLNNEIKRLKNIENNYLTQNNIINKLKCQIETLNIDIKCKENTINNLQNIVEHLKTKSNDNKKMTVKDLAENDKESNFLLDINYDSIERDIIIPCNKKVNSIAELDAADIENKIDNSDFAIQKDEQPINNANIMKLKHNLTPKHNRIMNKESLNYNIVNELEDSEIRNRQMEKLDQDILDLKTKLKKKIPK